MKYSFSLFLTLVLLPAIGQKPLLQNPELIDEINATLEYVYNLEYEKGDSCISVLENEIGVNHPGINLIKAFQIYWKARPMAVESEDYKLYVHHLTTTLENAENLIETEGLQDEAIFYCLASSAMLTELYAEEGASFKVLSEAKRAYSYLKKGFDRAEDFPDFYFPNGLYDYYRIKYPELRPFYKSFIWLFRDGDLQRGIGELKQCKEKGIFMRQMAILYLFHVYLRYENDAERALPYAESLFTQYPNNNRFKTIYAESLIAGKKYRMAEPYANQLTIEKRLFFRVPGYTFMGMIMEGYQKYDIAKEHYQKALELALKMDKSEAHIVSMIYAGLARVAIHNNNPEQARKHYKMALTYDPYIPVTEEANSYLN